MGSPEPQDEEFLLVKDDKISEKDRQEILETIDKVVAENHLTITAELFALKPAKNGITFPLIINLAAIAVIALGFFVANLYFSRQQTTISNQAGTFFSAEGKLLEAVRKQSAAELAAKNEQIASIQGQLGKLDQEATSLRQNMDSTIASKERELRASMAAELEAEKARLQKLGISQAEIDRRMKAYQEAANAQFDRQLSTYQARAQAELAAKEAEIQAERERQQKVLAQASQERQDIELQAQAREAQMRSQFEAQQAQLQTKNQQLRSQASAAKEAASQAQARLQALSTQAANERLLDDQIVGSYNSILGDIKDNRLAQAQVDMASLRALLESPKIDSLPDIAQRRPIDLALINTLESLVKEKSQLNSSAPASSLDAATVAAAKELLSSQGLVAKAAAAQANGDAKEAEALYTQALTQIPAFNKAYTALQAYGASRDRASLGASDAEAKRLLAERDATIKSLRAAATAKDGEIAGLNRNLVAAQSTIATLREELTAQGRRLDQLTRGAGSTDVNLTELQTQAARQAETIASLKEQLATATTNLGSLSGQLTANEEKLKLLDQQISIDRKKLAYYIYGPDDLKTAEKKARDAALDDVLLLTFYFSGQHDADTPATVARINEVAANDPLYRDAAVTIQSLALNGSYSAPVLKTQFTLIGPISYVGSHELTVERLADVQIHDGETVMIRHKDSHGIELPVAVGKVASVASDRVDVTVSSLIQGTDGPKLLDLAYLQAPGGS